MSQNSFRIYRNKKTLVLMMICYIAPGSIGIYSVITGINPQIPSAVFQGLLQALATLTASVMVAVFFYLSKILDAEKDLLRMAYTRQNLRNKLTGGSPIRPNDKMLELLQMFVTGIKTLKKGVFNWGLLTLVINGFGIIFAVVGLVSPVMNPQLTAIHFMWITVGILFMMFVFSVSEWIAIHETSDKLSDVVTKLVTSDITVEE